MPLSKRDLLILRAIVSYPWATDNQIGHALNLRRATVTRARLRLRDKRVFASGYSVDLDLTQPGPVTVLCGRGGSDVSDKDLARGLDRLLKDHRMSGAFIAEGGSFIGAVMDTARSHLSLWSAAALSIRAPHAGGYLVHSLEAFPFPLHEQVERTPVTYRPFLEVLTGRGRLPGAPTHKAEPRRQAPRPLRKSEVAVARSLIAHPDLPIAEAAHKCGLSRSTFAHVKGALLSKGYLQEAAWVNLPALGFPVILVTGLYRRPRSGNHAKVQVLEVLSQGTAPVASYASPTHEVTVTPYPHLAAALNVQRALLARERELELLAPPFIAPLLLTQAQFVAHSESGDLTVAWLGQAV